MLDQQFMINFARYAGKGIIMKDLNHNRLLIKNKVEGEALDVYKNVLEDPLVEN
jgi:hypothetical protein